MKENDAEEPVTKRARRRTILATAVAVALAYFAMVEVYVARARYRREHPPPVQVVYKSAAELAAKPRSQDNYPCLLISRPDARAQSTKLSARVTWCEPSLLNAEEIEEYEIDLRSGGFVLRQTDLFAADVMPLALTRTYRLWDTTKRAFGIGANQPYDIFPYGSRFPYAYMNVLLADGNIVHYNRISEGTSYVDAVFEHTGTPETVFDKSRVSWNRDHWDYRFQDGRLYQFPEAYYSKRGAEGALVAMCDAQGNKLMLVRDAAKNLVRISSPGGHSFHLAYDGANRIIRAIDETGTKAEYTYNPAGMLADVQRNGATLWRFGYGVMGMTAMGDSQSKNVLAIEYEKGRVGNVKLGDGRIFRFSYLFDSKRDITESSVCTNGKLATFRFDGTSNRWEGVNPTNMACR
jgi:YD repeat-containing protein